MQIFNLELMKTGYFGDEIFAEADTLYNRNGVSLNATTIDMMTDTYKVDGSVSDGETTYDVHLEFAKSRNKDYHILVGERSCTCELYSDKHKNCAHMATFLMFLNNYSCEEIAEGTLNSNSTSKEVEMFETVFMNDYKIAYDNMQKAALEVVVEIMNEEVLCYLKLGPKYKKKYIVRDIIGFAKMFDNNTTFEYGKMFSFTHSLNNFDKDQQRLVKFLIDLISKKQIHPIDHKFITLGPSELEILFGFLKGNQISIKKNSSEVKVYNCVEAKIPFELKIIKEEEFYDVFLNQLTDYVWFSKSGIYSIKNDHVSFNQILDHKILEFLETIYAKRLKVLDDDFFSFYDNVLLEVGKHIKISADFKLADLYKDIYKFELFVDTTSSNNIRVDAILKNEVDKIDYNFVQDPKVSYSKSGAIKLTKSLLSYGTLKEHSIIISDDNLIFDFCSKGIVELAESCNQIYTSERFKKMKTIDRQKIHVGVKISNNLLNIDIKMDDIEKKEILKILKSYHQKKDFHRLDNGNFIELSSDFVKELNEVVTNLNIEENAFSEEYFETDLHRGLYLNYLDSVADNITLIRDNTYDEFLDKIKNIDKLDITIPDTLQAELKNYQKEGFKFLKTMQHLNFGAILADDMGLGKTIQVITVILSEKIAKPSLIVCPSSLIFNWEKEFRKFAPSINVITINEDGKTRAQQFNEDVEDQIIITSYELLKRDFEFYDKLDFQYFVIDESHYIKNAKTQNFKTVTQITADFKMALTGTPIENSLSELWSLFDFTVPGYLGTYAEFSRKYETPILKGEDHERFDQLKTLVNPFILRRLKSEVLNELPQKKESFVYVDLHDEQAAIYKANFLEMKQELEATSDEEFNKNKLIVLSMLTKLRQLACDPKLVYEDYTHTSTKVDKAVELVKKAIATGQKTLLFSQFTSMLDIIAMRLEKEGISYYTLKGSTKKHERHELTEKFNQDSTNVFLISLKAGGTGLNLVGANTVIHFDPWWNMSAQNQATDRVYRIGQERDVEVYKMISKGTIEEKIVDLQAKKSQLAENMLSDSGESITKMSKEDLLELFT